MTLKQFQKEWNEKLENYIKSKEGHEIFSWHSSEHKRFFASRDRALIELILRIIEKTEEFEETYCERDEQLLKNIMNNLSNEIKKI